MKLEDEVEYSEYVLPVCLPSPALAGKSLDFLAGASPTVIGYGAKVYSKCSFWDFFIFHQILIHGNISPIKNLYFFYE